MIVTAIELFTQMDVATFVYFFWFFVVFDAPRYVLSMVSVTIGAVLERSQSPMEYSGPVSVLLVGHNEGDSLTKCIRSLHEQSHKDLQIVIVDDGSTDNSIEVTNKLKQQGLVDIAITTGMRGGKASALNLGLNYCKHEIVVQMDIDTSLERDAIEEIISPFSNPLTGAVSGNLTVRNAESNLLTRLQTIEYILSLSFGRRFTSMMGILTIVSGAFGAFRKSAIHSVGGWDVGPGDDGNLTNKMRRSGWRIYFAHRAWALTQVPDSLPAYTRQRLRWSRSIVRYKLRKFRSALNPFSRNFSAYDAAAIFNILFFQVGLTVSFFAYLAWLIYEMRSEAIYIILATNVLYIIEDTLSFTMACVLYRNRKPERLGIYLPAYSLFSTYIARVVRLKAYYDELVFRRSYQDSFVPAKVQNVLERF